MNNTRVHRFDEKIEATYRQYIRDTMSGEVSLERELERVLGKEKADTIIRTWAENRTVASFKDYLEKTRTEINTFREFIQHLDEMWTSPSVIHTHVCSKKDEQENSVTYSVTECIWASIMRELGAQDLGLMTMCDIDFITAGIYNPKITLHRSKTLMNGDEYCDFKYTWDE